MIALFLGYLAQTSFILVEGDSTVGEADLLTGF